MTPIDRVIQCPYCRRASTASLYVSKDGEIRLDHDCPACGHRGIGGADVLAGVLRYEAAASLARDAVRAGLDATFDDLRSVMDIEPMYRTPDGVWYGLGSKRVLDVLPTPEGECDLFDPRYDHIGDLSAREASDLDDPGYCSEEGRRWRGGRRSRPSSASTGRPARPRPWTSTRSWTTSATR